MFTKAVSGVLRERFLKMLGFERRIPSEGQKKLEARGRYREAGWLQLEYAMKGSLASEAETGAPTWRTSSAERWELAS